jgi:membrane-bound serine protease (ClpP class)
MKKFFLDLFILTALWGIFWQPSPGFAQDDAPPIFLVMTIDNKVIGPVTADYIANGVLKAEAEKAAGIILVMDTPGGLLESTRAIVKTILNSPVPFITYISPSGSRAGSAGVFITLASHVAAMAPSTNIGAAHPVDLGGDEKNDSSLKNAIQDLTQIIKEQGIKKPKKNKDAKEEASQDEKSPAGTLMETKILNDTLAWIETIAKSHGRNADWAKKAVLESASATEKEALDLKVIDLISIDTENLLKKIQGMTVIVNQKPVVLNTKNARLEYFNLTLRQNILNTIILMAAGFLGLFIEITHPGVIFPGILGIICLIVAFYAFAVLPVNFAGFLLMALGVLFFIGEALTPATFGLLTISGAACMLIGSLMLINSTFLGIQISLNIILPLVLAVAAIVIFLITNVIRAHQKKVSTGPQSLIGQAGFAKTHIAAGGEGQVFVDGELWTALNTSKETIQEGEKIKVLNIDKIKLIVSQYDASN